MFKVKMAIITPLVCFGLIQGLFGEGEIIVQPVIWERNGISEIPDGLMGVHATPYPEDRVKDWGITQVRKIHWGLGGPTRIEGLRTQKNKKGKMVTRGIPEDIKYVVDCFYDRYQAALQVRHPDEWKKILEELAEIYARGALRSDQEHFLEFWNEPYLNWSTKPGVNYVEDYYQSKNIKKGDPMILKGTAEPVPGLEWDKEIFVALHPQSKQPVWHMTSKIPAWGKEGQEVKFSGGAGKAVLKEGELVKIYGQPHILGKRWIGRDTEQKHYWAGPVNVNWYVEMLRHFGPILKKKAPDVRLAGGWGFNMFNADWASWRNLYVPLLDACHPWIDAIHEHHYGGDTRFVGMSYEVAWAYTQSRYGKRLRFWNTEAGGAVDPEQPGNYKPTPNQFKGKLKQSISSMTYTLRDISFLMTHSPDKARFRAAHEAHHQDGDAHAFRLLKSIRGDSLVVENQPDDIWVSAATSKKGTAILIFNDRRGDANVKLKAPMEGPWTLRQVVEKDGQLSLVETPLGKTELLDLKVPKKSAVVVESSKVLRSLNAESWVQYAAEDILVPLKDQSEWSIVLDAKSEPVQSRLRLVLERDHEKLEVKIGEKTWRFENVNGGVQDLDLGTLELQKKTSVGIVSGNDKPGRLLACSLWLKTSAVE